MLNDHTDAEIARREHAREMGASDESERAWLRFCNRAEAQLAALGFISTANGSTIDGDEEVDGFSIDGAFEAWDRGKSVPAYVEAVTAKRAKLNAEARAADPRAGVSDLEALAAYRPGELIEKRFTALDTLTARHRPDYSPPVEFRHNGVRIERERAVELIGERG